MPSSEQGSFAGQVVCVAGASRGIGRAVAEAFAAQEALLLLLARSDALCEVAAAVQMRTEAMAVHCDINNYTAVEQAVERAEQVWGRIDVLVNASAVLGAVGPLWETDPRLWADTVGTDLTGTYHTMRAVLPGMIRRTRGSIVNFAGGGAAYGYPLFSAYGSSKAAVVRLTETAAMECSPHGVRVNVIAPGAVETDMLRQVRAAGGEVRTTAPMELSVGLVLFLASDAAAHLTGRFIHARDDYRNWPADLHPDLYKLRRVES